MAGNTRGGGPAFPTTKPLEFWGDPNGGMTLCDYFAAHVVQGELAKPDGLERADNLASYAYEVADAMLHERAKTL